MKIYHYHPDTGVYLGIGSADESPLEPGVWLIPAYATETMPPRITKGKQAVFSNGSWALQPIPAPEPAPAPAELTPEQKLASIGLTVEELRAILLSSEAQP